MTEIYRFRREIPFARPAAAIWPFVSDSARLWEFNGMAPYRFEERLDAQGRVRRFVRGKLGPFPARWEEDFGEWQENHRLFQVRNYQNGPIRHWEWACELIAEGEGCRLIVSGMAEPAGFLGFVSKHAGIFEAEFGKAAAGIERIIRESDGSALVPGWSVEDLAEPAARQRLDALGAELARDPASHALAPNLIDYLRHAPVVDLRSIRPMALATLWSVPTDHAVELFLTAARKGIVAMGWELLCPRCRGAKSRATRLQDLPKGAHCSSCNIDYERNFSRNVELTFHPEPWIRSLPDGEMCMLGQGSARHIKFQGEVAAQSATAFELSLAPGPYRFRTVEAGAEADRDIGANGVIPTVVARGPDILLEGARARNELAIRNESDRPLVFVVENRNWAKDALTGERVIAMPAFRRLCPSNCCVLATMPRSARSPSCSPTSKARQNSMTRWATPRPTTSSTTIFLSCQTGCSAIMASSSRPWAMRSWPPSPVPTTRSARRSRSRTMSQASTRSEAEPRGALQMLNQPPGDDLRPLSRRRARLPDNRARGCPHRNGLNGRIPPLRSSPVERPQSTYCGPSRSRPWTPQLGGERA